MRTMKLGGELADMRKSELREYRLYFAFVYPICFVEALVSSICKLVSGIFSGSLPANISVLRNARVRAHEIVPFMLAR